MNNIYSQKIAGTERQVVQPRALDTAQLVSVALYSPKPMKPSSFSTRC